MQVCQEKRPATVAVNSSDGLLTLGNITVTSACARERVCIHAFVSLAPNGRRNALSLVYSSRFIPNSLALFKAIRLRIERS